MTGMSSKETREVLSYLESQGAKIEATANGYRVLFPDGSTSTVHWTTSDWRLARNLRRDVKAAGIDWPFDQAVRKLDVRRARTEAQISAAIEKLPEAFTTVALVEASGMSQPSVARYLKEHHYRASRSPENRRVWVWSAPPVDEAPPAELTTAELKIVENAVARVAPTMRVQKDPHHDGREFYDSVDSWTIPVPTDWAEYAEAMRMHIEVRVWRKADGEL